MKKHLAFAVFILMIAACSLKKDPNVFDSDKLVGKYRVDLAPIVPHIIQSEQEDNGWERLGKGLVTLALSNVDIELSFYENRKGVIYVDGKLIGFAIAFGGEPIEKVKEFSYQIENDSILFVKVPDKETYEPCAIIRKFSESYDYLQFIILEEGKEQLIFNLKRIGENNQ